MTDIEIAKFKLKGIPAVLAVLLAAGGYVAYRTHLADDVKTNPKVKQELQILLMSEISKGISDDAAAVSAALKRGDKKAASAAAKNLGSRKVEVTDIAMRGAGDDIVIKADYIVHGPSGPESKTDYFQFSHSSIAGWRYEGYASIVSWYLKVF